MQIRYIIIFAEETESMTYQVLRDIQLISNIACDHTLVCMNLHYKEPVINYRERGYQPQKKGVTKKFEVDLTWGT